MRRSVLRLELIFTDAIGSRDAVGKVAIRAKPDTEP